MQKYYLNLIILLNLFCVAKLWDTDELEIFDLVEEINENFYKVMGLSQDASRIDVKRAFRNLSIILHPDKNDSEDANIQFRNLVSIYEILKDDAKREKYNKVLRDGLPNWKSAVYYYRRVKKIGLTEGSLIVFLIISIGQYFFAWAAYFEKKYTAEQIIGSKLKKLQKRKTNKDIDSIFEEIPPPSLLNTLPFQIPRGIWHSPYFIKKILEFAYEYQQIENEKKKMKADEISERLLLEKELIKERDAKKELRHKIRKRKRETNVPVKTDDDLIGYSQLTIPVSEKRTSSQDHLQLDGGIWTDDDVAELVHLVKKFPGGTLNRWGLISQIMNRSISEVTYMASKLKDVTFKLSTSKEISPKVTYSESKMTNTKQENILVPQQNWSQDQQRALEIAIIKYRKTSSLDRWHQIATNVPGKSKEECLQRYKYLVGLVKLHKCADITTHNENVAKESFNPSATEQNPTELLDNIDQYIEHENLEIEELLNRSKTGGKPKNKRKEKKKQFDLSSDDELNDN